ncbi:MAG: hypothetical protein WEC33_01230, partial [Dehalococcoidia bacterium]
TERFTFAAPGAPPIPGEGHAILSLDGGPAVTITAAEHGLGQLSSGLHQLDVGLATNDGRRYSDDSGRLASERIVIDAGGGAFPAAARSFDLALAGGNLDGPDTVRVSRGDSVALRWTTDAEIELHFHGYDLEIEATPERITTMMFLAEAAGRFPVESHLAGREATVLYVEVLP